MIGQPMTASISLRIPSKLLQEISLMAAAKGRSVSNMIVHILKDVVRKASI